MLFIVCRGFLFLISYKSSFVIEGNIRPKYMNLSSHLPSERLVVFIDILGFRDIVNRMNESPDLYRAIEEILRKFRATRLMQFNELSISADSYDQCHDGISLRINKSSTTEYLKKVEKAHFSDCLVLSLKLTNNILETMVSLSFLTTMVATIAVNLLRKGIFIRGGVARGWTYHNKNVVFGEGMIKAYQIEYQVAKFPRVVVDDCLVNEYGGNLYLKRDSDGAWFINIFTSLYNYNLRKRTVIINRNNIKNIINNATRQRPDIKGFQNCRSQICLQLHNAINKNNPELTSKYRWLANQLNEEIVKINNSNSKLFIEIISLDDPVY